MDRRVSRMLLAIALAGFSVSFIGASTADATRLGVGFFGGASFPIVQDDNSTGSQFGVRVPVKVVPFVTLEPYFATSSLGDAELTAGNFTYKRKGFDVTAFGLNAALTPPSLLGGLSFYPFVGIATHKLSRDGSEDLREVGYNFGLGFRFAVGPGFAVHLRGEFNMIATGDTSRKFANATLGATYSFFPLP